MAENLLTGLDFKSTSTAQNIRGIVYQGYGPPQSSNLVLGNSGCLYVDLNNNQVWTCYDSSNNLWKPFQSHVTGNISISTDVQEGDLIGLLGAGSWSTSGNLNVSRALAAGIGSELGCLIINGLDSNAHGVSSTEIFNGATWSLYVNTTISKYSPVGFGSLNAGVVAGGVNLTSNETFNGLSWSALSVNLSNTTTGAGAGGSYYAGLLSCGSPGAGSFSYNYVFNGTIFNSTVNSLQAKSVQASFGSQNSFVNTGGLSSTNISNTEIFNGSSWNVGAYLSFGNFSSIEGFGRGAFDGIALGGNSTFSAFFNGTTWLNGSNLSETKLTSCGYGTPLSGICAGGDTGSARSLKTELHQQSVYRKIAFRNLAAASNIGIAFGVTNNSFTANLIQGSLPGFRIPGNLFFGVSRFLGEDNYTSTKSYMGKSSAITGYSAPSGGVCSITITTLDTSLSPFIAQGCLVEITGNAVAANNGLFPITSFNGTNNFSIKNPSGSANNSGTLSFVYGDRLYLQVSSITVSGGVANISFTLSNTTASNATIFNSKVRVGQVIYLPYSATASAGSKFNYGAYMINSVSYPTVSVTAINPVAQTETGLNFNAELMTQLYVGPSLSTESHILGYNCQMRLPAQQPWDDALNGLV